MNNNAQDFRSYSPHRRSGESGQTMLFVLLALSVFLLGAVGFAVDLGNAWFHRQNARNAADAACTAGAMDMLSTANGTAAGGFTVGTDFQCSGKAGAAPCQYAALNGYSAPGLTANTPSNEVNVSFPSSVPGIASCSGATPPPECTASGFTANPYMLVTVTDRVQSFFMGLITGSHTMDVRASAACGLVLSNSPIPILVLNPAVSGSLSGNGNINITIVGGPQKSIQVNSNSTTAVSISGGSGTIDLTHGGPTSSGSDLGVNALEGKVGIFNTAGIGQWIDPAPAISDPYAQVPFPAVVPPPPVRPSDLTALQCPSIPCGVLPPVHGCQDAAGCQLYTAGLYTTDIQSKNNSLIFDPGVYYMQGNLVAGPNSCLRPSTGTGDGSGGTTFYFSGNKTINVTANSGTWGVCQTKTPPVIPVPLSTLKCIQSGAGATVLPAAIVASGGLTGNVLLGPCNAPSGGGTNYGDPLGANDPLGEQRGMLFFQDRDANLAATKPLNQPSWGGGGAFGLAGFMYFHYCNSIDGPHLGTNCNSGAYTDQLSLQGGACSSTYVVGNIVVDELSLGGNPCIEMDLNPNALYYVLKASLLE